ncbi:MAG: cytochrome P450, partial [Archangium sp.]
MTPPRNSVLPPGPKSHWLLGTGVMQVKDPLGQLIRAQQRYGDIVYFNMFEGPTWLLCHPDQAQHVLADNFSNYPAMGGDGPHLLLGRGLFVSQGDYWRRQRRMVQPAFHPARLARMVEGMVGELHLQAERWAPHVSTGEPVELLSQMRRLALGMLGTSIFSNNIYENHAPLRESIDFFTQMIHGPRDSLLMHVMALLRLRREPMERFVAAV